MTLGTGESGRGDGAGVGGRMKRSQYGNNIRVTSTVHQPDSFISTMSTSIKRQLSPSPSTTPKAPRVIKSLPAWSPLLCTLPPTCHPPNQPTPLSDTRALEAHYATHHAHVCSSPGCGCVFPDSRLLELVRQYICLWYRSPLSPVSLAAPYRVPRPFSRCPQRAR
jgi:hypothetical protein